MKQAHSTRTPRALATSALHLHPLALALYGASLLSLPLLVRAQVVVAAGNTKVYNGPNGVQVVDIATPNAAGLSHNVYTEFNVDRRGMVLNNGDTTQITRQSQLAGQVTANMNLNSAARVILNEVTSPNRSTLAGYVEVLGSKADVIVANQYGITCNGCGFINTPRVTLTTGVPDIDADGRLAGLRVSRGDIAISGTGLNGGGVDYLDLVARSVTLDGQINGADLAIAAGNSSWDYLARTVQAGAAGTDAPAWGIDSSALGGMYANRIRLMSTEQGVGVRLLGDAAASAADLTLSANGQITVQARLSAQAANVDLAAHGAGSGIAVAGTNAGISAGSDIGLASGGDIALADAALRAGAGLRLRADGALRDSASAGNSAAVRFAAGTLDAAVGGRATLDGSSWGAGAGLTMEAGALAVGGLGATFYSGGDSAATQRGLALTTVAGDMDLGGARLVAPGPLALAAAGALTLGTDARVEANTAITLRSGSGFSNGGTILAVDALALRAGSVENRGRLQAGAGMTVAADGSLVNRAGALMLADMLDVRAGAIDNQGALRATGAMTLGASASLSNGAGGVVAGGTTLDLSSAALDNRGALASAGLLRASVTGALSNSGTVVTETGAAIALRAGSIVNSGALGAGGTLALEAGSIGNDGTLQSNTGTSVLVGTLLANGASGKLLSLGDISILGGSGNTFALDNRNRIQAGGLLTVGSGAARADLVNTGAAILFGQRADLAFANVANSGTVHALGALSLDATGKLGNAAGGIIATGDGGALIAHAGAVDNAGSIESGGSMSLEGTTSFANSGKLVTRLAQDGTLSLQAATLHNSGLVSAADNATLSADEVVNDGTLQSHGSFKALLGRSFVNNGRLLGAGAIELDTAAQGFALTNTGLIEAAGDARIGTAGRTVDLVNAAGSKILGADMVLSAGTLDNQGVLQASRALQIGAAGAVSNGANGQMVALDGTLAIDAGSALSNDGALQASGNLGLHATGLFDNQGSARALAGSLRVTGASVSNGATGFLGSGGTLSFGTGASLVNRGMLLAGGALDVDSTAAQFSLINSGRMESGATLSLGSGDHLAVLENQSGGILLAHTVLARTTNFTNSALVQGVNGIDIDSTLDLVNGDGASMLTQTAAAPFALHAGGALTNSGTLAAAGDLHLIADGRLVNDGKVSMVDGKPVNGSKMLSGGVVTLDARGGLLNNGLVEGTKGLAVLNATAIGNGAGAALLSGGGMSLSGAASGFGIDNSGRIQAANGLAIGSGSVLAKLANRGAGIIVGDSVGLDTTALDNAGLVQGGSLLRVAAAGSLVNQGTGALLADGGADAMLAAGAAGAIANAGTIQSSGSMALAGASIENNHTILTGPADGTAAAAGGSILLTSASGNVVNAGMVTSNGSLAIRSAADIVASSPAANFGSRNNMTIMLTNPQGGVLDNAGKFVSEGDLSLTGSAAVLQLLNKGSFSSAGELLIGQPYERFLLSNSGTLLGQSVGIHAFSLSNLGTGSRILTAMDKGGALTLSSTHAVLNEGAIHADGALALSGASIHNAAKAGMSAGSAMSVTANSGNLFNEGALFSAGAMTLAAVGHTVHNKGDIDVDLEPATTLRIDTGSNGTLINEKMIVSSGAMTINTGIFSNQAGDALPDVVDLAPVLVRGNYMVGDSGDFHCNDFGMQCAHSRVYQYDFYRDQDYSGEVKNSAPAQLISKGDLTLDYGISALNRMSLISGVNVNLKAGTYASAFENVDLHLTRTYFSRLVWIRADHDEVRYPTTLEQYDTPRGYYDEEAPGDWAHYHDSGASQDLLGHAVGNYARTTSVILQPGQTSYNAGIYARGSFNLAASFAARGAPMLAAAPTRGVRSVQETTGAAGAFVAADGVTPTGKTGLGQAGGDTAPDAGAPPASILAGTRTGLATPPAASLGPVIGLTVVNGATSVIGANGALFTGPSLILPASPNGRFVAAAPNNTQYLVETNPLFGAGGALGSNYLAQRLGFDPDTVEKRLGDANYEGRLVREQIIAQTNNYLLGAYAREADQMRDLMDNAALQSSTLGLIFGRALTAEQAGNVANDMVWMVEATVNGQKVLAPVVYLSARTRESILSGSVVAARDINITGASVSNQGGTMVASNTMNITTTGDITNTGGTLRANTVALTSTTGNVINETAATFRGNDSYGRTSIGPTGTITASGALSIDAAQDVRIVGAAVGAGGDASIKAGKDIVLDTIQDKRADTSGGASGNTSWSRNEVDTKQIASTLSSGGNLTLASKNDIVIAGSQVNAGGKVSVDAGRDLNLVDRQDTNALTETTRTSSSGFTTQGASVGYAKTDTTETTSTRTGTSVGASIVAGGDTSLKAGNTVLVQGSDVAAGGKLDVSATDVKLLAGQNTYEQTIDKQTKTTGVTLGVDTSAVAGKGSRPSAAEVARSALDLSSLGNVSVGINSSTTTSHSQESNATARVSSLGSGGNTTITATGDATFVGTQVNAGGDIKVDAVNINMIEAKNTTSLTQQTETTGLNISVGVDPTTIARKAIADNLYSGGGGGVTLASITNTKRDVDDASSKGTLTSFTSGGSITRTASDTITDQGSQITAAGDFTQKAATINMLAATDTTSHSEKLTSNSGSIGVSVDFATAKAANDLKDGKPGTAVNMLSGPTIGIDGNYTNNVTSSSESTSTARVGNIVAGGAVSSESTGATRMQGTNIIGGEDIAIKAATLVADAARDTKTSSGSDKTVAIDARVQVDLSGAASGSLAGGHTGATEDSTESRALTGSISSGKNLTITTTGDASFEGTRISGARDVTIAADGALNMTAASDTAASSSAERGYRAGVSGGAGGEMGVNVGIDVKDASAASSTARAGSVAAGGNLSIKSGKDITLEGTSIGAGGNATIDARDKLNLLAATSTSSSKSLGVETSLGVERADTSQSITAEAAAKKSNARSQTETGTDLAVGGNLMLKSGGTTLMQGTQVDAGGKATIDAGGGVIARDTVNSSSSDTLNVYAYAQLVGKRTPAAAPASSAPAAGGATPAAGSTAAPAAGATTGKATAAVPATKGPNSTTPAAGAATATAGKGAGTASTAAVDRSTSRLQTATDKAAALGETVSDLNAARKLLPLAHGRKDSDSDSKATAVTIREGGGAAVARLPQVPHLMTLPVVQSAVQVNKALAAPLAQYGSQAAIPESVKRAALVQAGVQIAPGANVDALLTRTQAAGRSAAVAGLSSANLDTAARDAALRDMGLAN